MGNRCGWQMGQSVKAILFFCHGVPGSEKDAELLVRPDDGSELLAPNLLQMRTDDPVADLLETFDELTGAAGDRTVELAGFSLGAMAAIRIAAARPARVARLSLISPAAPFGLGNFLPDMAGRTVFRLAAASPAILRAVTAMQGVLVRYAPDFLIDRLFAGCCPEEKALLSRPHFRDVLREGLANSYSAYAAGYTSWLRAYLGDWSGELGRISCPVDLWHGTKDTWSPITMSHALCEAIGPNARLHVLEGAGHYSTLTRARLCAASG